MPPLVERFNKDMCCIYKDRRKKPHCQEWPPYQPTSIVNVTVIHYKNRQTRLKLIEIPEHFKTGASGISKLISSPPSHSTVTKDISEVFRADPADQTEGDAKSEPPKLILIEGAPGIGKTVLAKEIAYLWADHKLLTNCKLLILVYLRDPRVHTMKSIEELLQLYTTKKVSTEVTDYLERFSGQNVAFVFDGFDEFLASQEGLIVTDIIGNEYGRKFCRSIVVVTSRPTATLDLCKVVDRRIEVLGLASEERDKLISLSISQFPDKRMELEKYFKEHPLISSLCYVPLNLAIVLYLFHQDDLPETLTEMNKYFVFHTVYRNMKNSRPPLTGYMNCLEDMPKYVRQILQKLSKLSFEGLHKNQLVFTYNELKDVCPEIDSVPEAANGFGLLQAVQHHPRKGVGTTISFNFLHLTIQEYLAACYVATLPNEQQRALLWDTFAKEDRFNFMWIMYVGSVGIRSGAFASFIRMINVQQTEVIGMNAFYTIQRDKRKCLYLFQCYMEAKVDTEIPKAVSSIFTNGNISLTGVTLLSHHITFLVFFMSTSSAHMQQWKSLELNNCNLQRTEMNNLLQGITNNTEKMSALEYVDLSFNRSSPWGVYCTIIKHGSVNSLTLYGDKGMNEYIKEITDSLQANKTLESITLLDIGKTGVESVRAVLMNNLTLKELHISWKRINDSKDIENKVLMHRIFLPYTDDLMQTKVTVNESKRSKVVDISILYDDDESIICSTFSSSNNICTQSMHTVNLSRKKINDDAAHVLAFGLCNNTTVEELNISNNNINDEGAIAIIDCLKYNKTLKKLDLSLNEISINGMKEMLENIESQLLSVSLEYVDLSKNSTSPKNSPSLKNSPSPWGPYCAIIRHCCGNSLTLCGDKGMKEYIKDITDSLQANTTLQSLSLYSIGKIGVNSIKAILMNNFTIKGMNLSWEKINDSKGIGSKILMHRIFLPYTDDLMQTKVTVNESKRSKVVDISILYDDDESIICSTFSSSNNICTQSMHTVNLSRKKINDDAAHVLAFGLCNNTTVEELNISNNNINDEGAIAIIDCLKYNKTLKKLDLSLNEISINGMKEMLENIESQLLSVSLEYVDLSKNSTSPKNSPSSKNSPSPWGPYCAIIRHCCGNSLTLCGDKGMKEYIKDITDSLQANTTLQSLSLYSIGKIGVNSIKAILMNNFTIKGMNLSWEKINDSKGIGSKILMHRIFLPYTDDLMQTKVTVNESKRSKVVDISILYDDDESIICSTFSSSNNICTQSMHTVNLSRKKINDDAAHVLAFGLCNNTTVEELNISNNNINDEGAIAIIDCLKYNKTLKKLDLSLNEISINGMKEMLENIESQLLSVSLEYVDLSKNSTSPKNSPSSKNSPSPWGPYCAIIRHCCGNSLTLCGDKGMKEYIKDITDSLQANTTLQSLSLYSIGKIGVNSIKAILMNNFTIKGMNLSWEKINDSKGIESKILMNTIFSPNTDDLMHTKTTVNNINRVVDVNILYDNICPHFLFSNIVCTQNYKSKTVINLSHSNFKEDIIGDDAAHVLAFGFCNNTIVEELNVSHNHITSQGAVAIIESLKHNKVLKKLDLSCNKIVFDNIFKNIENPLLEYFDLSGNDLYPWAVYCAIIRHCSVNSLTLVGDVGMEYYIQEITDSLQANTTLQSLTVYSIGETGVNSIKAVLMNNFTLKRVNLSWKKINDSRGRKILIHRIFSPNTDDLMQYKTTVKTNRVMDVNILYDGDHLGFIYSKSLSSSSYIVDAVINLSGHSICNDAAHVLAFGLCNNTTVEELNISHNCHITDEGAVAIIDCLKHNTTLKKLDISHNGISEYGMKKILDIFENQVFALSLEYIDLSKNDISRTPWDDKNSPSPWGVYCAIIRHCCGNSLTLCGNKGMKEYIKEILDSLQINITLQSLTLCDIGEYELQLFESAVSSLIKYESLIKKQKAKLWRISVFFTKSIQQQ